MKKKMTPQEKIVAFMEMKRDFIEKSLKKSKQITPSYFVKEDKEAILKWSDKIALKVLSELDSASRLINCNCPFCISHRDKDGNVSCETCKYGKIHGKCKSGFYDDYSIIADQFHKTSPEQRYKFEKLQEDLLYKLRSE
jgi:hypothetical protein